MQMGEVAAIRGGWGRKFRDMTIFCFFAPFWGDKSGWQRACQVVPTA